MRIVRLLCVTAILLGLAAVAVPPSATVARPPKVPPKGKPSRPPQRPKPHVHHKRISHVKPVVKKRPESQKKSDQQLVEAFRTLRSVRKTLIFETDRIYGGHQAKAVHAVENAEKQLQEALKSLAKKSIGAKGPPMTAWEPEKLSNSQLASKIPALKKTIALLGRSNHDYGGHREQAIADLRVAIVELEKALNWAKTHSQKKR